MITLCGSKQARIGFTFLHLGPTKQCQTCDLLPFCQGRLREGRVYVIVGLRQKVFPCAVHEGEVRVVEVEEAAVKTTVPARSAIEGAVISFSRQECNTLMCSSTQECRGAGLFNGDKCQVQSLLGKVICPEGRELRVALLKRRP